MPKTELQTRLSSSINVPSDFVDRTLFSGVLSQNTIVSLFESDAMNICCLCHINTKFIGKKPVFDVDDVPEVVIFELSAYSTFLDLNTVDMLENR